jgi:hypothetical protein
MFYNAGQSEIDLHCIFSGSGGWCVTKDYAAAFLDMKGHRIILAIGENDEAQTVPEIIELAACRGLPAFGMQFSA